MAAAAGLAMATMETMAVLLIVVIPVVAAAEAMAAATTYRALHLTLPQARSSRWSQVSLASWTARRDSAPRRAAPRRRDPPRIFISKLDKKGVPGGYPLSTHGRREYQPDLGPVPRVLRMIPLVTKKNNQTRHDKYVLTRFLADTSAWYR